MLVNVTKQSRNLWFPGMFPWVCLATMPLFYPFDWPKNVLKVIQKRLAEIKKYIARFRNRYETREVCKTVEHEDRQGMNGKSIEKIQAENEMSKEKEDIQLSNNSEMIQTNDKLNVKERRTLTCLLILFHVICQAFLPYSHFITQVRKNKV